MKQLSGPEVRRVTLGAGQQLVCLAPTPAPAAPSGPGGFITGLGARQGLTLVQYSVNLNHRYRHS